MTRIKRDQKIPLIGFVANTGGLLGLCMGFSLVSAFEIVYHCIVNAFQHISARTTARGGFSGKKKAMNGCNGEAASAAASAGMRSAGDGDDAGAPAETDVMRTVEVTFVPRQNATGSRTSPEVTEVVALKSSPAVTAATASVVADRICAYCNVEHQV